MSPSLNISSVFWILIFLLTSSYHDSSGITPAKSTEALLPPLCLNPPPPGRWVLLHLQPGLLSQLRTSLPVPWALHPPAVQHSSIANWCQVLHWPEDTALKTLLSGTLKSKTAGYGPESCPEDVGDVCPMLAGYGGPAQNQLGYLSTPSSSPHRLTPHSHVPLSLITRHNY